MRYFFGSGHSALAHHQRNVTPRWLIIRITIWCLDSVHSWGHASVPLNSERTYCTFSWLFLQIEWIHNKDYLITGFGKGGWTAPLDPWSKYPRWTGKPCTSSRNICSVADSVGDPEPEPDPQDPHVFGLLDPDPDPLVRGTDPDPYLFLINVLSGLK